MNIVMDRKGNVGIDGDVPLYINIFNGSVGTYDEWYYENVYGEIVNAVDLGEVELIIED